MKQYAQIKARYPEAMLLFRVGDFYETFGEDAVRCAQVLGITLTKRANGAAAEMALAGFPHHSLDQYLPRLVRSGLRVAVCDQMEDPKLAKGIVQRDVTELVSPAVAFSDSLLDHARNNFLAAIHSTGQGVLGLAFCDATTGSFQAMQGEVQEVIGLLRRYAPVEVLGNKWLKTHLPELLGDGWPWQWLDDWVWEKDSALGRLQKQFHSQSIKGFGLEGLEAAQIAAGAVLHYLQETRRDGPLPLYGLSRLDTRDSLWMDPFTVRTLELLEPQQTGGMSLASCLDASCTPMGKRLLRQWVAMPLRKRESLEVRQNIVDWAVTHPGESDLIRADLTEVGDMERMAARIGVWRSGPRELWRLAQSIRAAESLRSRIAGDPTSAALSGLLGELPSLWFVAQRIEEILHEDAPASISKGGAIREGYSQELDELRTLKDNAKEFMNQMVEEEIQRTRIASLKINYNQVFGFYLEVTHAHKDKVPAEWIRKQTLVNAERYITPELKAFEEKYLSADQRIQQLEQSIYTDLLQEIAGHVPGMQEISRRLSALDVLVGFGQIALTRRYVRPVFTDEPGLHIQQLRHPVLERILPDSRPYIPNDLALDPLGEQIWMITGPNMSGKSALLRQAGLLVVMAQVGSYVAATEAHMGIVDKLFTRVGAFDNLAAGESTFMVEMQEMATILHHMSAESLLLLDEIGRGTSTYDGISLAWAIAAYLHEHPRHRPMTLFATHYHELNRMADQYPRIANYHVAVSRQGERMEFLRTLQPGGSSHSFGLHVAKMAGVPAAVISQAETMLEQLESMRDASALFVGDNAADSAVKASAAGSGAFHSSSQGQGWQMSLWGEGDTRAAALKEALMGLNSNELTPIQALQWIMDQQHKIL
jgi:DNA mismatch repair protein MutS